MTRTLSVEGRIAAAVILGVGVGCLVAWLVFATHMPGRSPYTAFFPTTGLLVVYSAVAAGSLRRKEDSIAKLIAATLVGLVLASIVGGVLIQMIGCRFDACINL